MAKELLFQALRNDRTERTPWLPFVGCHGGALIGVTATQYLRSSDLMVQGIEEAIRRYHPDGIPVMFDLQIEAEALGCELQWGDETPPAVVSHVLEQVALTDLVIPDNQSGRISVVLEAMRRLTQAHPDIGFYGLITGPFTLALHLRGTDIFMDLYDQPKSVHQIMDFCTQVGLQIIDYYLSAGCDVIAVVDPMTSQISPETFKEFESPYAKILFDSIRDRKAYSSFFVCGHAQKNVAAMCQTGPDNICIDENISLTFVKEITRKYNISFGGNLKLTLTLLLGTEEDVQRETLQCLQTGGEVGYILAPGCDLPFAVPPKNLEAIAKLVHDPYQRRVVQELMQRAPEITVDLNLADYGRSERVIVDIITLDSEACAPCQYMVEAVKSAAPQFGDLVEWREHKIKYRESVEFMMALMVKNIPTICIDGKITFVSQIPTRDELIRAIQLRINEKFNLKLRQQHNRLLILGAENAELQELAERVEKAVRELGSRVLIEKITDTATIQSYGLANLPAVVTVKEGVKESGRIPSVDVIKEWLKELD